MSFANQRFQPIGLAHVGPVVRPRGDRVHGRDGDRVTGLGPAERSGRQDPDPDGADGRFARPIEQAPEIMSVKAARQRGPRARIEQVVADLGRMEDARLDDAMDGRGVTEGGDPEEANLALPSQSIERRYDTLEHGCRVEGAAISRAGVVQLEEIHAVQTEPSEARFERFRDRVGDSAPVVELEAELGAEDDVRPEDPEHPPEILLGLAVSVRRGSIEIVDAELERASHGALLFGRGRAHHQPADVASAEPESRHLETGATEPPSLHSLLLWVLAS